MIYITTPDLLLRDWQEQDLSAFAAMNADARVMEHFPAPLTAEQSAAYAARIRAEFATEGFGQYALERRSDGAFLGYCGLHRVSFVGELNGKVEIGWRMPFEFWGNGYATQAARACLSYAAGLGIEEVVSFTTLSNVRSQRVMQRLGMEYAGEFDHPALPEGHPLLRHVLYRIRTK